jgi:hypothetical protein
MSEKLVEQLTVRGISVYRFYKNTRDAVDQYLATIDAEADTHIKAGNVDKPMIYVLDVSRSGMYSLNYMKTRAGSLIKQRDKFPDSFIAYVTDNPTDSILVNMVNALASRDLDNTRKIFKTEEFDQAIDWLLSMKEKFEDSL